MRYWTLLLALLAVVVLAGCKHDAAQVAPRPVRTVLVDPKPVNDDRQAVGEVKPRYESDLSFRVAGKRLPPGRYGRRCQTRRHPRHA